MSTPVSLLSRRLAGKLSRVSYHLTACFYYLQIIHGFVVHTSRSKWSYCTTCMTINVFATHTAKSPEGIKEVLIAATIKTRHGMATGLALLQQLCRSV